MRRRNDYNAANRPQRNPNRGQPAALIANRFIKGKLIAKGGFGAVFRAKDSKTGAGCAIKLENKKTGSGILNYEAKILQHLQGLSRVPKLVDFGSTKTHNYMAMENVGYSVNHYHCLFGKLFSEITVALIAIQAIEALRQVHSRWIVHRDMKPDNMLISKKGQLYLIDFGLAKRFVDQAGRHIQKGLKKRFRGTMRYCSMNMHKGVENSRRDDLESLGYVLIYLAKGRLPWQQGNPRLGVLKNEQIVKVKATTKLEVLCGGLGGCFLEFMKYVKALKFSQEPDYELMAGFFEKFLSRVPAEKRKYDWADQPYVERNLEDVSEKLSDRTGRQNSLQTYGEDSLSGYLNELDERAVTRVRQFTKQEQAYHEPQMPQKRPKNGPKQPKRGKLGKPQKGIKRPKKSDTKGSSGLKIPQKRRLQPRGGYTVEELQKMKDAKNDRTRQLELLAAKYHGHSIDVKIASHKKY